MKFCPGFFICSACGFDTVYIEGGKLTDGPWTCIVGTGITDVLYEKIKNKIIYITNSYFS